MNQWKTEVIQQVEDVTVIPSTVAHDWMQAYTQAPRQTTPASDPILEAISQLMEKMTHVYIDM